MKMAEVVVVVVVRATLEFKRTAWYEWIDAPLIPWDLFIKA